MAYQKINFLDQNVERPRTYEFQENQDGTTTLVDSFGIITEIGTPINAENMNHIEDGIVSVENNKMNKDFSNATSQPWSDRLKTDHSNDTVPYLKHTYVSGASGYRIWSDGYCIQWGTTVLNGSATNPTASVKIWYLKTFSDLNYNLVVTSSVGSSGWQYANGCTNGQKSTTGFNPNCATGDGLVPVDWHASGYLAAGQY